MARESGPYDSFVADRKRLLFAGIEGVLVEIGPGTGPNLRHLPAGLTVVGVEPNPFMHRHFLREAREGGHRAALIRGRAEALPFRDESVDAVVATLVLCSVGETGRALEEVKRILKPGGKFIFMEHVAAPEGTWLRRAQALIRPAWRVVGDGCEPDRRTEDDLVRAGFREVRVERFSVPLLIVAPHIAGVAVK